MLNKTSLTATYFNFINEFKLPPEGVALGFGGALVMHGARKETSDIDADVDKWIMDWFSVHPFIKHSSFHRPSGEAVKVLTVKHHPLIDLHLKTNPDTSIYERINGIPVYTLEYCLEMKRAFNRAKDQKDIRTIEGILADREALASIL